MGVGYLAVLRGSIQEEVGDQGGIWWWKKRCLVRGEREHGGGGLGVEWRGEKLGEGIREVGEGGGGSGGEVN